MEPLRQIAPELQALTEAHGGTRLRLDRLQVRVDLVPQAGLRAELRERIEREDQALI